MLKFVASNSIIIMVDFLMFMLMISQAALIDQIATPYRDKVNTTSFYGLSSVFFKGAFDDLGSSRYTIKIGTKDCEILFISATELECLIPPWDSSDGATAELKVKYDNSEIYSQQLNYGNAYPIITLNRNEASAGDPISFYPVWNSSDKLLNGSVKGQALKTGSIWTWSTFYGTKTQLGNNIHGDSGIKAEIGGAGEADMMWTAAGYTLEGEEYFFRTIASVDSISHHEGSASGGLEITISGRSFPSEPSRVRVDIDGSECEVTSISFNTITCKTGSYNKTTPESYYEGSAGLFCERVSIDHGTLISKGYIPSAAADYSSDRTHAHAWGHFKAPRTGKYTFYVSMDDQVQVWLSTDVSPSNKQKIIDANSWSPPFMHFNTHYKSHQIELSKDQLYYLEIYETNCCDVGQVSLGVEIEGDGNSYRNKVPLVKKIHIDNLHPSTPIEYKGHLKEIGTLDCDGFLSTKYNQKQLSSQYFNLYVYCHSNFLYVVVPGYMNPQPGDLKFRGKHNEEYPGQTLHEPSDSQFWFVIPSDFLRIVQHTPQVRVWVDERLSICKSGICYFTYKVPKIHGSSINNNELTLTGVSFPEDKALLSVTVGSYTCEVTTNSETSIVCQIGPHEEGDFKIEVEVVNYKKLEFESGTSENVTLACPDNCRVCTMPTNCTECSSGWSLYKGSCARIQGFSLDENQLTLTGVNFPEDQTLLSVTVGSYTCEVTTNSETSIVCQIGSHEEGEFQIEVQIQGYDSIKSEGYAKLTCTDNCRVCTLPTNCTECSSGWNLHKANCTKICPTGFKCSETSYEAQGSDSVFEFKPQGIEKVVVDPYSSIPVKAGTGDQFYPFLGESDPCPANGRGYYFKGSSYMRLPPYESVESPILVFAEKFTVEAWFKPETPEGTILSKASNQTKVEIGLEDNAVYLTIQGTTYHSSSILNSNWNLAMVTVGSFSGLRRLQEEGVSKIFCETEFEDTDQDFNFVIGANATLQSFFRGFIWEIKVYRSPKSTPEFNSDCQGCGICPTESSECLSECEISEFWNGQECQKCSKNCINGCVNNSTCSLCGNDLCTECNFEVCTECVDNAVLNSRQTCECGQGYYSQYGFCVQAEFYAQLHSSPNNTLTLNFSEPLNSELLTTDYNIYLQNKSITFDYTVSRVSDSTYNFDLEFTEYVAGGEVLFLSFNQNSTIKSESSSVLSTQTLQPQLSEYQPPEPDAVSEARSTGQVVAGSLITSTAISSMVNGNPAALWALVNTLDILMYIPLSTNPLTPRLRAFFDGLNILQLLIPNFFEFVFDLETSPNSNQLFRDSGFESTLFLLNIGKKFTIFCLVLVLWPIAWMLSKTAIPFIARKCGGLLPEYQYNVFLRNWVQLFLDLAIASLIQVFDPPYLNEVVMVNYCIGVFFGLLLVVTPLALLIFNLKNKNKIAFLGEDSVFYRNWGALFYEYRCQAKFIASYTYLVFLLKRALFAASLVLLGKHSVLQHSVNTILMLGYTAFIVIVRPFKDGITQVTTIISEISTCLVFLGCYYFLQDFWENYDQEVEDIITYLALGVVAVQSLSGLLPLIIIIANWAKRKICKSTTRVEPAETSRALSFFRRNQLTEENRGNAYVNVVTWESEEAKESIDSKLFDNID